MKLLALTTGLVLAAAAPAAAATIPPASFQPGQTVALGASWAMSYDVANPTFSLGANVGNAPWQSVSSTIGVRGLGRFYQANQISAAVIAGVQYDPGRPGTRSYLVPDAGLALAYTIPKFWSWPLTLMVNLTLTVDQTAVGDPLNPVPQGNLLQRLTVGPNTTIGALWQLNDHLALTVGGGTIGGMRLNF